MVLPWLRFMSPSTPADPSQHLRGPFTAKKTWHYILVVAPRIPCKIPDSGSINSESLEDAKGGYTSHPPMKVWQTESDQPTDWPLRSFTMLGARDAHTSEKSVVSASHGLYPHTGFPNGGYWQRLCNQWWKEQHQTITFCPTKFFLPTSKAFKWK